MEIHHNRKIFPSNKYDGAASKPANRKCLQLNPEDVASSTLLQQRKEEPLKGIKLTIPYSKTYSLKPEDVSRKEVAAAIVKSTKIEEPINMDMLLVAVHSPNRPNLQNVIAHIFSVAASHGENPKGVFIDWKKSPENTIEITANHAYFI
jgi:hypothetical protein